MCPCALVLFFKFVIKTNYFIKVPIMLCFEDIFYYSKIFSIYNSFWKNSFKMGKMVNKTKKKIKILFQSNHIEGCNGVHGLGFIGPDRKKKCLNGVISVTGVLRVIRYEAGSRQVSRFHWCRVVDVTTTKGDSTFIFSFSRKD